MSELNTFAPYSRGICEDCAKIVQTKLVTTMILTLHGMKAVPAYACVKCERVLPHTIGYKEK